MRVHATIREIPPDHRGHDMPSEDIVVEADDYDQGVEQLRNRVKDGWQMILVRTS